ncbi:MAG: hypothetical protein KatS3mg027_1819 [Bacteroidia bacterium]|nr:MAG: hypothetical protein KatS3mg027_1819 [Bacteroidia bacterium]
MVKLPPPIFILLIFCALQFNTFAQTNSPGIEWRELSWFPTKPNGQQQTQTESDEDWWYNHENIYNNGVHTGYVACGYSGFINHTIQNGCLNTSLHNPECTELETPGNVKGSTYGTIGKLSLTGKLEWIKYYNEGELFTVKQTNDGGFIAVGYTKSTHDKNGNPIAYNPESINSSQFFIPNTHCDEYFFNKRHATVIKIDAQGDVIWNYLYGFVDYITDNGITAYKKNTKAFDIVETTIGYKVVGDAETNNNTGKAYTYVFDIDFNGLYLGGNLFFNNQNLGGTALGIAKNPNGNGYVITGKVDDYLGTPPYSQTYTIKAFVRMIESSNNWYRDWPFGAFFGNNTQSISFDVTFDNAGNIIWPVIDNCSNCNYYNYDRFGQLKIFVLTPTNGTDVVFPPIDLGQIRAFDLKAGVTALRNGGFAVVSTKRTITEVTPYFDSNLNCFMESKNWRSDAYLAKFNSNYQLMWEKTFDADDLAPSYYPGDLKKAECLYHITEADDGGLVISGNSSHNFDDNYIAKIYSDCVFYTHCDIAPGPNDNNIVSINNGVTTWTGNLKVRGSIQIETGSELIIDGAIVEFADTKRLGKETNIIVKPGGLLTIKNGALLTAFNNCPDAMWDGIQVWGNPNANQSPALQGRITISNATITNARVAVTLSKKGDCCGYNGGYIIASNSSFINNFKSIEFMKYHRPLLSNGVEPNNLSFVTNCTFTSNDYLRDPNWLWPDGTRRTHDAHITLWDVKGVSFRGNSFSNTLTNLPFNKRGEGIRSIDATYRVESTCLSYDQYGCTGVPNTFTNLFIGIKESATPGKISQLTCSRSVFNDVEKAIIIENTTGSRIVLNTFNHSYNPPPPSDPFAAKRSIFAVYANSSTALQVEQNTINFPQNLHKGIIVRNSRELGASVYRNTLHGAATRVQAEADNSMALIDCNDFYDKQQNRQQDIALTSGYLIDQGTCQNIINFPTNPEANRFYGYCDNNILQLAKNATVPGYIYSAYSNPEMLPDNNCVTSPIQVNNCISFAINYDQACPSNLSSIKTIHQHKELANDYFAMQQQIKILLEAGNSPALYHSLQHDAPGIAKNNLLQASPYLSEQLLLAIVARGLPAGILKEILSANSPLPATVLDALQQINLPNGVRSQIMALQNGVSPYTQALKTIEFYEASARQNIAEVIRQYLDSNDVRSAKVYLEQFEAPEYVCAYVPVAIDARDTVSASLALEKIEIIADSAVAANPADSRAIHLKGFCEFYRMVAQIERRPNGYFDLDASEIEFIYLLAQDNSAVGARARAVYTLVSGEQLIAEPEELEENPSLRIQTPDDENVAQNPQTIRVYPNPSTGNVNIELTTEQQIETIHIIDISGKKVFEQKSNGTMQETLSLNLPAEGLYLLQVQYSNGTYETKKIHIVK